MGRLIKNLALQSASYAIRLPNGDNLLAPQFPVNGQMRFNTVTNNMEVFYSNRWNGVGLVGRVAIQKDSYTGNGVTFTYPMTNTYDAGHEAEIIVFIGGIYQNPGVSYTVDGYNISFTSVPDVNEPILILHNFNSTKVQ